MLWVVGAAFLCCLSCSVSLAGGERVHRVGVDLSQLPEQQQLPLSSLWEQPEQQLPRGNDTSTSWMEVEANTSSSIPWVIQQAVTALVQSSPSGVITGLFRSQVFNDALAAFLQESSFLEQMLLRDDLLTEALCGTKAVSKLQAGWKNHRVPTGTWELRIRKMKCGDDCVSALKADVERRHSASNATFANGCIDMPKLLASDGMTALFLKELSASPGLAKGLTPERMSSSFGQMEIVAYPKVLHGYPKKVRINVRDLRMKTGYHKELHPLPSTIAGIIDKLSPEALKLFLSGTLSGFIPALVSEAVMLAPEFPMVLNAALEQAKMDMWVEHVVSASGDIKFLTGQHRRCDTCPDTPRQACKLHESPSAINDA